MGEVLIRVSDLHQPMRDPSFFHELFPDRVEQHREIVSIDSPFLRWNEMFSYKVVRENNYHLDFFVSIVCNSFNWLD